MDRSLFLARLMGPTFVAIALGMLINLGTYESMIAEALHTGILFYSVRPAVTASRPRDSQSAQYVVRGGLAWVIVTVLGWLMTIGGIIRIVVPQVAIAIGSTIYGGRAPTIVAALIIGALGAFLSFKGYVRRA